MKKFAICCFALLMGAGMATRTQAQSVAYYGFTEEIEQTYVTLTDATEVADVQEAVTAGNFRETFFNGTESTVYEGTDVAMTGINIGFDFSFGGKTYDKFVIGGIGYLYFGEKGSQEITLTGGSVGMERFWYPVAGVGASKVHAFSSTAIKYKIEGATPNRVLTVEYADMAYASDKTAETALDYQIKLYEADSHIEILFGTEYDFEDAWMQIAIGLHDAGNNGHYREPSGDTWAETEYRSNGFITASGIIPAGLKYTFTLPEPCQAPTVNVSDLALTATSTMVTGEASVEESAADGYIVVSSTSEITGVPEAGTYAVGDELLGGKVLAVEELSGTSIRFEDGNENYGQAALKPNTTYHYAVYLYNFKCSGEPQYGSIVSESIATSTSAPASLEVVALSGEEIRLAVTANDKNENVLVAVTDVLGEDHLGNRIMVGDFGYPEADAKVGDTIWKVTEDYSGKVSRSFGGTVLYTGSASDAISFTEGLKDNTIYHFAAFSLGENGQYSSLFAQADTITSAKIPFYEDFSSMPAGTPYGWTGSTVFQVGYDYQSGTGSVLLQFSANATETPNEALLVFPPMDFPTDADLRLIIDYSHYWWVGRGQYPIKPSDWSDNDSIAFEVSVDGGKTFTLAYAITKINADNFDAAQEYLKRNISIKGFRGAKQARLRIRYVSSFKNQNHLNFKPLQLIEIPACDYPASVWVTDSSIVGDKALLDWMPGASEESEWNISYAVQDENGIWEEWSEAERVTAHPCNLTGLESNRIYKARVQAVCGNGLNSDWKESNQFNSGLTVSFVENFNNLPTDGNIYRPELLMPSHWNTYYVNKLNDTLHVGNLDEGAVSFSDWKTFYQDPVPGKSNGSVMYSLSLMSGASLVTLPLINIESAQAPYLHFDAALGLFANDAFDTLPAESVISGPYSLRILVSNDKGKSFILSNSLQVWDSSNIDNLRDSLHCKIDLTQIGH